MTRRLCRRPRPDSEEESGLLMVPEWRHVALITTPDSAPVTVLCKSLLCHGGVFFETTGTLARTVTRTAALYDTVTPSKGPFPLRHYEHAHLPVLSNMLYREASISHLGQCVPFLEPSRSFPSVCYTHT